MSEVFALPFACLIAVNQPIVVGSLPSISVNRDWLDVTALVISAVLMLIGILGVGAALRTLKAVEKQAAEMVEQATLMKEQTAVAQKAADAALLNAQAVINAERPWLLIKPSLTVHGMPEVTSLTVAFKATNVGRSPAEIIFAALEWITLLNGEELRNEPFFSEAEPAGIQWTHTRWLEPSEGFVPDGLEGRCHISDDAADLWKLLKQGTRILIVMGYIRYRDAISNGVHESRYCYLVSLQYGTMVMTGPPGYNKLT